MTPVEADVWVLKAARKARMLAFRAEPPLNPNHPNQMRTCRLSVLDVLVSELACLQFPGRQSSHYGACRLVSLRSAFSFQGPTHKPELRYRLICEQVLHRRNQGLEVGIAIHQGSKSSMRLDNIRVSPTRNRRREMERCVLARKIHRLRS